VKGELRERVARALAVWYSSDDDDRHWERYTGAAGIALAALGLDDLDAAVARASARLKADLDDEYGYDTPYDFTDQARDVLEATLTPPETVAKKEHDTP
jgi:hypothetical protein